MKLQLPGGAALTFGDALDGWTCAAAALKCRGWVRACVATGAAVLVLASWPDTDGVSVRLVIASAILFGFVAATAARLMRGLPVAVETSAASRPAHDLRSAA